MTEHDPADCTDRSCKQLACKLVEWRRPGTLVSPAATPTRKNHVPPKLVGNSWEKGIAKDERGMPVLRTDASGTLTTVGIKEWGEKHRRRFQDRKREIASTSGSNP